MKITVNPKTGAMEFDATPEEAVALMNLQQEVTNAVEAQEASRELVDAVDQSGLTTAQYLAWDFLVQHENATDGVTTSAVGRHLRITAVAASSRLQTLVGKGYAERLAKGRYRALCP